MPAESLPVTGTNSDLSQTFTNNNKELIISSFEFGKRLLVTFLPVLWIRIRMDPELVPGSTTLIFTVKSYSGTSSTEALDKCTV